MRVERIRCGHDTRDPGAQISMTARQLVWRLQAAGIVLALREGRRSVLVRPGERVSPEDRAMLTQRFHEIRDLLLTEKPA